MLTGLRLSNIALIQSLDLTFKQGFTVLTGETGAGKSILLDALDALLGGLSGPSLSGLLRTGCERGHIEASFTADCIDMDSFTNHDFDADDNELLVSRVLIRRQDRIISRFRINGVAVSKDQILSIRPSLIDLTGQGQVQELSKSGHQRDCLDCLGGSILEDSKIAVKEAYYKWKKAFSSLQAAQNDFINLESQISEQKAFLSKLEAAQLLDPEEDVKLLNQQDRLAHTVRIQEGLSILSSILYESNSDLPTVLELLNNCLNEINILTQLDSSLSTYLESMLDVFTRLDSLSQSLQHYASNLDSDPQKLDEIQDRISYLKHLKRISNCDLSDLISERDRLRELINSDQPQVICSRLAEEEQSFREFRDQNNTKLSELRHKAALKLQNQLLQYLKSMGLPNVRFKVELNSEKPTEHGVDSVLFLFSSNPDQPLAPLIRIASGGEMSRFLLALKTTLASRAGSSTLIFDEIDSGVSGKVSTAIAVLLKELSFNNQVFCVTHQPLVAAKADNHLRVSKFVEGGFTNVEVSSLERIEDREKELAELAGGDFAHSRLYASSLLSKEAA